ncbi:MAG: E3 ubiquitin ligase family protein [Synechococcales cyanobacterium K44_A2020_017]|jgi:hypothetical protein|nr:E3 ubiquitin ligase family protein [Synechococcales cyanobacterium K32_A2020_035]MBF2095018.1 E3 ubiquitin ligase family protein [Synechococcales cyanobacterium K44_A2020_017]
MHIVGFILIVVGISLFFVQRHQKQRAFSLKSARPTTVAELQQTAGAIAAEIGGGSWRDYVKVVGQISCDRPLVSELKQETCVHYKMTVTREYEETVTSRDKDGKTTRSTRRSSETVSSNQQSVPFWLEDATGRIEVNPQGAAIETIKVLDEFRQGEQAGNRLTFGQFSVNLSAGGSGRRTLGYRYKEQILPLGRRALVLATVSDGVGSLVLQKPLDGSKSYLISLKTDEELTQSAEKTAQAMFYGMVGCTVLGVILVLVGLVT